MGESSDCKKGIDSKQSLGFKLKKFDIFHCHNYKMGQHEFFVTRPIENVTFHYVIHEMDPLIDSAEMNLEKLNQIVEVLRSNYCQYECFLIIHGTDTMEHTASSLSFLIKNLSKPIMITGSQVPLLYVNNDAFNNFYTSLRALG